MLIFCNRILLMVLRGFILKVVLQQGQRAPSQIRYMEQFEQRFCPVEYLPLEIGVGDLFLYLTHNPLQVTKQV